MTNAMDVLLVTNDSRALQMENVKLNWKENEEDTLGRTRGSSRINVGNARKHEGSSSTVVGEI